MSNWTKKPTHNGSDAIEDWCYECGNGDHQVNTPFTNRYDVKWLCVEHTYQQENNKFDYFQEYL